MGEARSRFRNDDIDENDVENADEEGVERITVSIGWIGNVWFLPKTRSHR